jgi:CBS domain-containing protein
MKVSDLHQQRLFTAEADETLDEVADRMRWHAIAALPVFDASMRARSSTVIGVHPWTA